MPKTKSTTVKVPTAEELLEAGVHFGHLKRRWYPKMAPYIYSTQEGVHVLDLYKTREMLSEAAKFLRGAAVEGGILFVGTKRQVQDIVKREAERAGAFYLARRWVGGLLTNFSSVKKNIEKLEELSRKMKEKEFEHYTKKERLLISREIAKLEREIGGLVGMKELPAALVLSSSVSEAIAWREAKQMGIPVVAICDTNADPTQIDYPIPGNDDASGSVEIIMKTLADSVAAGKSLPKKK